MVHQVLTNEKYIGNNVYNRVSFKLKRKRVRNPPDMWVRADGAFTSVVDPEAFFTARGIIHERNRRFSDEDMIACLRTLLSAHRNLSGVRIDDAEGVPSSTAYRHRFGSLLRAYRLAGYEPPRDYEFVEVNQRLRQAHPRLLGDVIQDLQAIGASVVRQAQSDFIVINGIYSAALYLCRCSRARPGGFRWRFRLPSVRLPDLSIVVCMDEQNEQPSEYYILPSRDVELPELRLTEFNGIAIDTFRFDTLEFFVDLAKRVEVAA